MSEAGVNLDGILGELGQFGRYQIFNYGFLLLPIIFSAIYNGQYVFNVATVPYRRVYFYLLYLILLTFENKISFICFFPVIILKK